MICIRSYNPGTCHVGPGPLISIIEDESRLEEIKSIVEKYNSGLGEYGKHYSVYIENDVLINKLPEDLINPQCKCGKDPVIEGRTRYDDCPIHGAKLAGMNNTRWDDPVKFDCKELLKQGKMIDAIKLYRSRNAEVGLHEAKKIMMSWDAE